jgi:uncharacterized protein HemX
MADERVTTTETDPHATVIERRGGGGPKKIIAIIIVAVLIAIAFAVFGRRSGEGQKDVAVGTAALTAEATGRQLT